MIINMKAIYISIIGFLAFICSEGTPQAELAQKTTKFSCVYQ